VWKPELRFIHMVRVGSSEMLSQSKLLWLQAAVTEGVPASTFEIWRWFGGALDGRMLRLRTTPMTGSTGGSNGKMAASPNDGEQRNGMHYRDWGAQTEADLLWQVFVRNGQGVTWCGIEERDGDEPELPL
jgi:hypothetical protein